MAEITTIARPYAEAAFSLAREGNALPVWSEMLRFASAVVADPQMARALDNPLLDGPAKESLLLSIAGDRINAQGRSFLHVLVEGDRLGALPAIAVQFDALKDAADGVAKAVIETAFPLEGTDLQDMQTALEKRFGRKIEATVEVRPELIGGARITVGDTVIDATVQEQLRAMATKLRS
jgi:F-type H+-transporting ATPase subunit delta